MKLDGRGHEIESENESESESVWDLWTTILIGLKLRKAFISSVQQRLEEAERGIARILFRGES